VELTGGRLCGAVRFRVSAEPLAAYYCHCTRCQRNGGGPFMVGATVPVEAFALTEGKPAAYESSPGILRLFFSQCGSPLGARAKTDQNWSISAWDVWTTPEALDRPSTCSLRAK